MYRKGKGTFFSKYRKDNKLSLHIFQNCAVWSISMASESKRISSDICRLTS